VTAGADVDFGRAAGDYGRHRRGYPEVVFERLRERYGVGVPGQRVLDVGTGTGQMARGLARGGAAVTGLDRSAELLEAGEVQDRAAAVRVRRVRARAEALPFGVAFDVVSVVQAFHWLEQPRFLAEARRVLVPGGRLVIGQFDWLPLPGSVPEATEALILEHNPGWALGGLDGLPTHFVHAVQAAGLRAIETFSLDVDVATTHADWRGRIRASAGVAAGPLSPAEVVRFDGELAALLAERFPDDPLAVPHRVFCLVARSD